MKPLVFTQPGATDGFVQYSDTSVVGNSIDGKRGPVFAPVRKRIVRPLAFALSRYIWNLNRLSRITMGHRSLEDEFRQQGQTPHRSWTDTRCAEAQRTTPNKPRADCPYTQYV